MPKTRTTPAAPNPRVSAVASPTDSSPGNTQDAAADNTRKAYAADWAHFTRWCRIQGIAPLPPSPEMIGLYLSNLAAPPNGSPALSAATIDRRLSGLAWHYAQRGATLERASPHIAAALAEIRRTHARPPQRKDALRPDDIHAMVATLGHDLRGLRDRAMLLLGYAGGLPRSEIVGLDMRKGGAPDAVGWLDFQGDGGLLTINGLRGRRAVEIARSPGKGTCPVRALEQWLLFSRIDHGPVFVRTSRDGTRALGARLNDRHVARLIKQTVLAAGLRPDLPERERLALFSGQSLRAGSAIGARTGSGSS